MLFLRMAWTPVLPDAAHYMYADVNALEPTIPPYPTKPVLRVSNVCARVLRGTAVTALWH